MFTGYVFSIVIADHPTVVECIRFPGRERSINIPQEISTNYHYFGLLLLEDTTEARIRNIEHKHKRDPEKINIEILREWIDKKGKQPVSWETLIEVLYDIGLDALASEIKAVKLHV